MSQNYLDSISNKELSRLRSQHEAWLPETRSILEDSGFSTAERIIEFGCGPGFTVLEMATSISPDADITGIDMSDLYLNHLASCVTERNLKNVRYLKYDATRRFELQKGFDAAFCRWFLAWVTRDLDSVVGNIFDSLRPGGVFVAMEYLTLNSTVHSPPCSAIKKYLTAWEDFYRETGGTTEVGAMLPEHLVHAGFQIEDVRCVGGLSYRNERLFLWWRQLYESFRDKFKEIDLLSAEDVDEIDRYWESCEGIEDAFIYSPILVQIRARK